MNTLTPMTVYEQLSNLGIPEATLLVPPRNPKDAFVAPRLTNHVRHFDTTVAKEREC
ncbi:MAG: hypothetical protein ACPGLY_27225 [Rubripirellula sp.]